MKLRGKAVRAAGIALVLVGATAIPAAATTYGAGWDGSAVSGCAPTPTTGKLAVLAVNGGSGYTSNGCLAAEVRIADANGQTIDLYVNGAGPLPSETSHWPTGSCAGTESIACANQYGENLAADDITRAAGAVTGRTFWWIDVEGQNTWHLTPAENVAVIQGMRSELLANGGLVSGVGLYSNSGDATNWPTITDSDKTTFKSVPLWSSSPAASEATAQQNCLNPKASFAGGPVVLAQFGNGASADGDVICPPVVTASAPKSGAHYTIKGTGFPGSAVSVVVRETDRTDAAKVTTVSASGLWSITATTRYNATVTAVNTSLGGSSPLGSVKVTPVVKQKLSAGACSVTVSGSITPYAAGESLSLATKGHGSVSLKVTKNKAGAGVIAKKTVHEACGAKVLVAITTSGKAKGKTYSQPLTTSKWTTVRTKA